MLPSRKDEHRSDDLEGGPPSGSVPEDAKGRRDRFLAWVAHDIRNPLNALRNAVELQQSVEDLHPIVRQAARIIERQVGNLTGIMDDLLEVSRMEGGRLSLSQSRVSLSRLLRAEVDRLRATTEDRILMISLSLPDEEIAVSGDEARLLRVIRILGENAAISTPDGGRVSIRLSETVSPGSAKRSAEIEVCDSGPRIREEALSLLMDLPLPDGDAAGGGRSVPVLPLAFVKGMAALHGGEIVALNGGTEGGVCFLLRLPSLPSPGVSPERTKGPEQEIDADFTVAPLRILLIEDDADTAQTMKQLLETDGHEVHVSGEGGEGLELAERVRPDVVFCDLGLPGEMDGYEVARRILATPGLDDLPLVAVSGYGAEEDLKRSRYAGFLLHLVKPVAKEEIRRLLALLFRPSEPGEGR